MLPLHQRSIFFYSSPSSQSNRYLEVRFLLIYFDLFGVKSLQACVPHIRYILNSPRKFNKENVKYLPGIKLGHNVVAGPDLENTGIVC
ncbi:putative glycerol-3-phosphate dehydrogenase (NAD(+)) [Helianthus anomalus]